MIILQIIFIYILAILILRRPYLGIILTAAYLPVDQLLYTVPRAALVVPLIGAMTLAGFFLQRANEKEKPLFRFSDVHILALLFIAWMFVSNPAAAWFGAKRNWILTAVQLWVLMWLTGELLDTPQKQRQLMWAYTIMAVVSAYVAIQTGNSVESIGSGERISGLVAGANDAARYFIVALVFLNYLRTVVNKGLPRILAIGAMIVLVAAVFITLSRTGLLLLIAVIGLTVVLRFRRKGQIQLAFFLIITMVLVWFTSDYMIRFASSIVPSITQGSDTVGIRYGLWEAGWRMWLENIIRGVGVGMYPEQLKYYAQGLIPIRFWHVVAHNMYVQVLAETGLVGFVLFMFLIFKTLKDIWNGSKASDPDVAALRNPWLVAYAVMLLGGITMSDQHEKLIWMAMGVSVFFLNQMQIREEDAAVHETASSSKASSFSRSLKQHHY